MANGTNGEGGDIAAEQEPNTSEIFGPGQEIETLFKATGPFRAIEGGHGYYGVVLRDKKQDLIQCHICGEWFILLSHHVRRCHNIPVDSYRKKFGLMMSFPLCSLSHSRKRSEKQRELTGEKFKSKDHLAKLMRALKNKRTSKQWSKRMVDSRSRAAWSNMLNLCKDQVEKRFMIVAEEIGHEPSMREMQEIDKDLRYGLEKHFGTLNAFKEKMGYNSNPKPARYSRAALIGHIRRFVREHHEIPTPTNFLGISVNGYPGNVTYYKRFGSWSRALAAAGFDFAH